MKKTAAIRPLDLDLLQNLVEIEGRPGTEILHRALVDYATAAEDDAKIMADEAKAGALRTAIKRALAANRERPRAASGRSSGSF